MDDELQKIDINQAGIEEFAQISGIAENLARRIIEYRETVHPFEEVIELAAVPGISERMVREFADQVTVGSVEMVERTVSVPDMALEPKDASVDELLDEEDVFEFVTDDSDEEPELADINEELVEPVEELAKETVEAVEEEVEEVVEEVEEETAPDLSKPDMETEPVAEVEGEDDTADLSPFPEPMRIDPQPVSAPEPVSQSSPTQGRVLGQILLGSILGAFVGALLTLAILAALNNGTLSFNQADVQLQGEIQNAQRAQDDLLQTVDSLDTELNSNLGVVATRTGELFLQQTETDESLEDMSTSMRQTEAEVAALEEVTEALDERLTTVAAAAETFDAFLDGLRDLLGVLDDGPGAADAEEAETMDETPEATTEVTPAAEEDSDSETATAVPSPTSRPTRTPRPTATLVPVPTSTPGQQP